MSRLDASMGKIPCDTIIKNIKYLDVFTCEFKQGEVAWYDGVIVGVEPGLQAKQVIEGAGKWLVPGFIDAHVHIESSLMTPANFQKAVLPKGTTTVVSDPHELANVMGLKGIQYFTESSLGLNLDLRVMMSSCVPATAFETNGGGNIEAADLAKFIGHPKVLGLAEVMNVPGVLHGDPKILAKLDAFKGLPIDGHCPLLRGQALSAYAAAGISSCHESSELDEAAEKLSKGISVWIREGSVAKDLNTLLPLVTLAASTSLGFCTDDRNPLDIEAEGHLDFLIRTAIKSGVRPEIAYRVASWSVARHYGLDKNSAHTVRRGAIAPGWLADLVLLDDVNTCAIREVFKSGKTAAESTDSKDAQMFGNTIIAATPELADLEGVHGRVHVIGVQEGKIITEKLVMDHQAKGVAKFSVLERYGKGSKPQNAYAFGFGENFSGAIASSVGHDSHNLAVVGTSALDQSIALKTLIQSGGGFCVVNGGKVLAHLALPLGGLMSTEDPAMITRSLKDLRAASRAVGCALAEPFLQLAFLSLPVIPSLKLTDRGLVDVDKFEIIPVRAS